MIWKNSKGISRASFFFQIKGGAEAIGFGSDLWSIDPGKLADLVILDGSPPVEIRNTNSITHVMKNGRLYEGDTLNEVWPRERTLPSYGWQDQRPNPEAGIRS